MPREVWRDDPEYLRLWRLARQQPAERAPHFVLADWLEEHGHLSEAWRERLHGLTGSAPVHDPDTNTLRAGVVPTGEGAWRRLLAAPPADDLLCVFDRDVQAYRYLKEYRGRCGWNLGQSDFSSPTEQAHLLAVPRLEMLACKQVSLDSWDWIMDNLPGLTHFEADGPQINSADLADLQRLPRLRALDLLGNAAGDTTALGSLPDLRHLSIGPFYFDASRLAALAPQVESLHADPANIANTMHWPRLCSLQMLLAPGHPFLGSDEVMALALHPQLERLNIRCGRVTAGAIKALASLPRLRELTLRFASGQQPPSLKALAGAKALESLTIEGPMNEARIREVATITGLRVLSLPQVTITGALPVAALAELQQLEELRLYGESEDSSLPALAALPHLVKLDLQYLTMSSETAHAVKEACPEWVECFVPE